jgi:NAD+ synthase (glutamine-hydrolysing)
MKIGIAQINTKVGDLAYNKQKIVDVIQRIGKEVSLIIFPEMTTLGYPPNDLLDNETQLRQQKEMIYEIREIVRATSKDLKVVLGCVDYNDAEKMPSGYMKKHNAAAIIGQDIQMYHKQLLPNYDVFFENRYFEAGKGPLVFTAGRQKVGVTICEDIWDDLYETKPVQQYAKKGIDLLINLSASPFAQGKQEKRLRLVKNHARNLRAPVVYVNQVGAQDELVFDGASMVVDKENNLIHLGKRFQEDVAIVDLENHSFDNSGYVHFEHQEKYWSLLEAMKLGLRDYLAKTWIKELVIGVSGGIDSALSLYVMSQVLEPQHIHSIYMPTKHNSDLSFQLSQQLADNLGIQLQVGPIDELVQSFSSFSRDHLHKEPQGIAYENVQARMRGLILMNIANDVWWLVINNSNKTELDLGYGTLYGDLIGGIWLIGDLNKKEIYAMAKYINEKSHKEVIPQGIITRKASAELQDGQVDPFDYESVSEAVEEMGFGATPEAVSSKYPISLEDAQKYQRMIKRNEFKKKQTPPVIKLKERSIGIGRLMPIVQG